MVRCTVLFKNPAGWVFTYLAEYSGIVIVIDIGGGCEVL